MSNLNEILIQAAINPDFSTDNPDAAVAIIDSLEVISFSPESALLFVVFAERASLSSSLMRTHTVVLKTNNGGETWRLILDANKGSFVKDEIFFLNETHGWFITQWQVAGTFPTLYLTTDFGETWQESSALQEAIQDKGGIASFVEAQGLRFKSKDEGMVIGKILNTAGENISFFLKTIDSGKTWIEINAIPPEYFTWISLHSNIVNSSNSWQIIPTDLGFSVAKSLGDFSQIYQAVINNA